MPRAILLAFDHCTTAKERLRPTCLLPLADRPILYHAIEELVQIGVKKIELLIHHSPQEISEAVGDGSRWGITISTHLVKERERPLTALLPAIESWSETSILLGDASEWIDLSPVKKEAFPPSYRFIDHEEQPTRWAHLTLQDLSREASISHELPAVATQTIRLDSLSAFFDATTSLLDGFLPHERCPHIREIEPGIWIGRSVVIHPEAHITPPVFIGPNTRIHPKARIGPYAFIEGDTIIDRDSVLHNTAVLRHSFIGEGLELDDCVVDRGWLLKRKFDALIAIPDPRILSDLSHHGLLHTIRKTFDRILSAAILLLTSPLVGYLITRHGLKRSRVVLLPAIDEPTLWRSCNWIELNGSPPPVFRWLPRLLNVVAGHAQIVGIRPRSLDELQKLPHDWRCQVLPTSLGSLSPQEALAITDTDPMQQLVTECYYAAHKGLRHDLKLLWRFLFARK